MRVNNFYAYNERSKNPLVAPVLLAVILGVIFAVLLKVGIDLFVTLFWLLVDNWIWALVGIAIIIFLKKYLFSESPAPSQYYPREAYQ